MYSKQTEMELPSREGSWLDSCCTWPGTSISLFTPLPCTTAPIQLGIMVVNSLIYIGNAESVTTVDGQVMKLHAFMDSMAGEQKNGERMQRPLTEDGWNYIRGLAQSIMKEFPADSFGQDSVNNLDSHSWTVESYNTAVDKVYPYVFKTDQLSQ